MAELRGFRLPVNSRHSIVVRFFSTLKDLRAAEELEVRSRRRSHSYACFIEYRGFDRTFGQLLFCPKEFGAGVVAHELQHVIMIWSERKGWGANNSPYEEKVAEFAEGLTRDFWKRFYRVFPHVQPRTEGVEWTNELS